MVDEAHPTPAVGAVIVHDGRLLLIRRAGGAYAGHWAVPGGRQRFGESMADAVQRETREETGLEVVVGEVAWTGDIIDGSTPPGYHFTVVDFFATAVGGELRAGDDAADARWVPLPEVRELPLTPTMYSLLDRIGGVSRPLPPSDTD
jgi:8-oxo-dGTP diphosphatase